MNWFLPLLILQLSTVCWAAPIDLLESVNEIQPDPGNPGTESYLSVQKDLQNTEKVEINEQVTGLAREIANSEDEEERLSSEEIPVTSHKPIENSSNQNEPQPFVHNTNAPPSIFSSTLKHEDPDTKVLDELKSSTNDSANFNSSTSNKENLQTVVETLNNETIIEAKHDPEHSFDISTASISNKPVEQVTHLAESISEPTTPENLHEDLRSLPNTSQRYNENVTENTNKELERYNASRQGASYQDAKIRTNFETSLIPETNGTSTTTSNPVENLTGDVKENEGLSLPFNNSDIQSQTTIEETTTPYRQESSSKTPALNTTVHPFINHRDDNGQSLVKAAEENQMNSSTIETPRNDSNKSDKDVYSYENISETETTTDLKSKEISEPTPIFEQAIDSFIADVVEIGGKRIPEKAPDEPVPITTEISSEKMIPEAETSSKMIYEAAPTTTRNYEQPLEPPAGKIDESNKHSNSTKTEIIDQAIEIITTTPSFAENLTEVHYNKQEEVKSLQSSDISRISDNLIASASVNFEKSITENFATNENKAEAATENPNEISSKKISQEEPITLGNLKSVSEVSSTQEPLPDLHITTTETAIEGHETIKVFPTTEAPIKSFQVPDEIVDAFDKDIFGKTDVLQIQNQAKISERMQVTEVAIHEGEPQSASTTHQPEIATHFQANENYDEKNAQLGFTESNYKEQSSSSTANNETSASNEGLTESSSSIYELNKTEDYSTSSINSATEVTSDSFKFGSTLKALTEDEKLTLEERHSTATEINQQATSPLPPRLSEEFTTLSPPDVTTVLPKKFEMEVQTVVKALEETTHHYFEEFQNNLKQVFKKYTDLSAAEATSSNSITEETTIEPVIKKQSSSGHPSTLKPDDEIRRSTYNSEEHLSSDVTTQISVDKFLDYFAEKSKDLVTVSQLENQTAKLQEGAANFEQTTESSTVFTTMLPAAEETSKGEQAKVNQEVTTVRNDVKEYIDYTTSDGSERQESTSEAEPATTEYIGETTTASILARVPLLRNTNAVSHNTAVVAATEMQAQKLKTEEINETNTTIQPTEPIEDAITQLTTESTLQEMVTFNENTDTTTNRQKFVNEPSATSPMPEPLTPASFMKEQQQQIESTTEHETQTQSAATSRQTVSTANHEESTEQQSTEAEIYSTTVVEENETTVLPVEPEARSLALPSPKLEYLQSADGVEVFYGYSIVKHN